MKGMINPKFVESVWSHEHLRNVYYLEGLRFREISIFDISQITWEFRNYSYSDIVNLYNWISENTPKFIKNLPFLKLINGFGTQTEIRLASYNIVDLSRFKNMIVSTAINELGLIEKDTCLNILKPVYTKTNSDLKEFLSLFQRKYQRYGPVGSKEYMFPLYSVREAICGSVWNHVQKMGSSYIFVAHASVPFMAGFYLQTKNNNIFLTEEHLTLDPYKDFRRSSLIKNLFIPLDNNTKYEEPLVLDKAYTGKTLLAVKKSFPEAKLVAICPKTSMAIKNCDYFIFNNSLFSSQDVNLDDEEWHFKILKKSLKGGLNQN